MREALLIITGPGIAELMGEATNPLERLNNFFNMPWQGKEWRSMDAEEIHAFFMSVLPQILAARNKERADAIAAFNDLNALQRFWVKAWHRWQEPDEVTMKDLIREMQERCIRFASWAEGAKRTNFYADSDMTPYIEKSRRVADLLFASIKNAT